MEKVYITTTLPYVNAAPHMGHALEFVQADILARNAREKGKEVFLNTGTDEHGTKVYRKAREEKKEPKLYADIHAETFRRLVKELNLDSPNFIRTTDPHHGAAAQEFWRRCAKDIEKGTYRAKYCVGCELEKTDSELQDGRCPIHPNLQIEFIEEENYFFKFSRYGEKLLALYERYPDFVLPANRLTEIKNFVKAGLKDFSVSRLAKKMPWGVPVPGDSDHVMYVWFDALTNYVSALGWPEDEKKFTDFWGTRDAPRAIQLAGKDNLRQQSAMWQAMLLSAGLPPSRHILIHGFITTGGEKMSKTVGNVVDPFEIIEKYGVDALRFWLVREVQTFGDADFTLEKFGEGYNAYLANGLGNFAARVIALASKYDDLDGGTKVAAEVDKKIEETKSAVEQKIAEYKFHEALGKIWDLTAFGDEYVNAKKPWEKDDREVVFNLVVMLDNVAALVKPFLPETAEKITKNINWSGKILKVQKGEILFPRIL